MFSRRNFVKGGLAAAGMSVFGKASVYGADDPAVGLEAPGPIPLNNILTDYIQEGEKYGYGLVKASICDKESWESKRISILQRAKLMLGEAPQVRKDPVLSETLSEIQRDGYKELKVQFPSGTGDTIKGYLLIPDKTVASSPRPGIIALHSTGPGASQTVGLTPREGRCYGMELAQRGYVVLAIDVISAGERIYPGFDSYYTNEFYNSYPQWSAMDKMIYDHKKGLDFLCSLDIVNPDRLGCIGHSLGGYNSFFLQAFDQRIKAAVSSCGFSPMGESNNPYQFARNDWFIHFNPICRDYIRTGMIPCDMHEIMALCAPRHLYNYSAKKDKVYYPSTTRNKGDFGKWNQTVDKALNQVSKVYEILGVPDRFICKQDDGGHDFPLDVRNDAYGWFDKWLA